MGHHVAGSPSPAQISPRPAALATTALAARPPPWSVVGVATGATRCRHRYHHLWDLTRIMSLPWGILSWLGGRPW